ncbi:MAG: arginine--tRNA ligase [Bacteroidales bacterium]|jgi:arginyl-tRNA synthetase|nr:arginine--tRNA ligase [Bacteroidales bacterium]MCI2121206.1 arginine--tRNA ligase [Bacteroidales bacterium]MCI2146004.1 arginine--tRNA ligase [Bacteroidales bacterium]
MKIDEFLADRGAEAANALYDAGIEAASVLIQPTRKEFDGDRTVVVFPFAKIARKKPAEIGDEMGKYLKEHNPEIDRYNVVNGFLNISLSKLYWNGEFKEIRSAKDYGRLPSKGKTVMVEFSSPNTNKPLHLGHIRNNLLGWSVSQLLSADGYDVVKANLVNDRGIHICKSMLAWLKTGNGETPESSGKKGDHLVGDYYVRYNQIYTEQVEELVGKGMDRKEAEKEAPVQKEAQAMLLKWEQGDPEVRNLWKKMNGWVYAGFDQTYGELGISFDRIYYESQTYLLGKSLVEKGLGQGVFQRHEDGSVWCDLTADGLDRKLLLRSDGTSVYMTQDLGTAEKRFEEYHFDKMIYVVGDEQNYHFQVLKLILKKLGFTWSENIYHLSYGMVELPDGKMKSREGTVVDADDLIRQMYETARDTTRELTDAGGKSKLDSMSPEEQNELFEILGLGALKYFILKVDPHKTMLFNPKESIDFNGNTGPFIQYTYARIRSILRRAGEEGIKPSVDGYLPSDKEVSIIRLISVFPDKIDEAAHNYSPAMIANYTYELAKEFNQYYHDTSVLKEENPAAKAWRIAFLDVVSGVLTKSAGILGMKLPERM